MNIKINDKYNVTISSQENEGLGVSKVDNIVTFVENGLLGDEGEMIVTEVKKNFIRGKMILFNRLSNERQKAPCPYYDDCGGCDLQHQLYNYQLAFKTNKIKTALDRIGGFKNININNIIFDDQFNYRNKVSLKISGQKLGFYHRSTNDIIDIDNCLISNERINEIIKIWHSFLEVYPNNKFDSLMIRLGYNGVMIRVDGKDKTLKNELTDYLSKNITSLESLILNGEVIYGKKYLEEKIEHYTFMISSNSFYQVNNGVMNKLYNKVIDYCSKIDNKVILDLYCGSGTITSLVSKDATKVIGIEVVSNAIKDAKLNAKLNGINNIEFIEGKVEDKIDLLISENIDTIIMDPPRSGVDKKAIAAIVKINPQQIIYVSCNPVTLARDLKLLNERYKTEDITPFDMFPQTNHVECVVLLQHKKC